MLRKDIGFSADDIAAFNSAVWKAKKDRGLSLREPVKSATIPEKLKPAEKDIKATHGIGACKYGRKTSFSF